MPPRDRWLVRPLPALCESRLTATFTWKERRLHPKPERKTTARSILSEGSRILPHHHLLHIPCPSSITVFVEKTLGDRAN